MPREGRYSIVTTVGGTLPEAEAKVRSALADIGFGVLTEIDVAETLKTKLGVERAPYKILGACNPSLANRALEVDEEIGLLLPYNVVLAQNEENETTVMAVEPRTMVELAGEGDLVPVAEEARALLRSALSSLE